MTDTQREHWAAGNAYEQFMGRWSADVASKFLSWLQLPPGQRWLDVGCGTGALTRAIATAAQPQWVGGCDPSGDFAHYARQQLHAATFFAADGRRLSLAGATVDAVVSGLALNFIPQPAQALADMRRVAKPGATVAAYVWDYAGKMEFLRYFWDVAVTLDAQAVALHEGHRFPLCQPEPLAELWRSAELRNVMVDALDIRTRFDSFASYWQPFTLGNFPAPTYVMSLDVVARERLRDQLRMVIPAAADGTLRLTARVWAVRGIR